MPYLTLPTGRVVQRCCRTAAGAHLPAIKHYIGFEAHARYRTGVQRVHVPAAVSSPDMPATTPATPAAHMENCIPGFLRWIRECNDGVEATYKFVPFSVGGDVVGYLRPEFCEDLARFPDVFVKAAAGGSPAGGLALNPSLATPLQRTAAVAPVLLQLKEEGKIPGWREELYPVVPSFHADPVFLVERAAAAHFGIKAYGVHVNGYVTLPDGSQELWVARRSMSKPNWPGKLDHIVAGGQPHGLTCQENVVKECQEEASISAQVAAGARPVGAVTYTSLKAGGLGRDVLFCYDLELPLDFVPQPQDGEVESFTRMPIAEVASLVGGPGEEFKANCNLVLIDFFLRHGHLSPDMPGYCELLRGLREGECS